MDHCHTNHTYSKDVVSHLDELLLKLPHSQVSPKWRQFGFAIRVPVETLDELSSYQEKERRLSEIADYWMKQHQGRLTWREVARIMKEIDLNDLAGEILRDCERTANGMSCLGKYTATICTSCTMEKRFSKYLAHSPHSLAI